MSLKQYSVVTRSYEALPRSKRLRTHSVGAGGSNGSGGSVTIMGNGDGHSHDNKPALDALSMDDAGYLYTRYKPADADSSVTEKIKAGYADKAGDADKWDGQHFGDYLDQAVRIEDSVKHRNVGAAGELVFGECARSSDFQQGNIAGAGFGVYQDESGATVVEADKLVIRKEATFNEIVINQIDFVLGETIFSGGGCVITSVEELGDIYRCYYDPKDGARLSGLSIGSQARCQRFDAACQNVVKYYWRLVVEIGDNYVDLSKEDADGEGIPTQGDNIVEFGHRTDPTHQAALVISTVGTNTPRLVMISGINSYVIPEAAINLHPLQSFIRSVVQIEPGSKGAANLSDLPDIVKEAMGDIEGLEAGGANMLRNSGFTGDYLPEQLANDTELEGVTQMFSDSLIHWESTNAEVQDCEESASGKCAVLTNGSLMQTLDAKVLKGETYILSFKAVGETISYSIGGVGKTILLTDQTTRYVEKFTAASDASIISLSNAICSLFEVQLERGSIVTAWSRNFKDNEAGLARYQALTYLSDAIKNASTSILGGLGLMNILMLGKYADGKMSEITAGMSGVYNDSEDVALWAGGSLEQAITAVQMYADDPTYQPTEDELRAIAKVVLTHGGRAILTDVILRGYIYAKGGHFRNLTGKDSVFENTTIVGSLSNPFALWRDAEIDLSDGYVYVRHRVGDNSTYARYCWLRHNPTSTLSVYRYTDTETPTTASPVYVSASSSSASSYQVTAFRKVNIVDGSNRISKQDNIVIPISSTADREITADEFSWGVENSGRIVRLVNYKWNSLMASKRTKIYAPDGKYFFEDGECMSSLGISRETVVLLGYGNEAVFWGWIVLARVDTGTQGTYGSPLKTIYQGIFNPSAPTYIEKIWSSYHSHSMDGTIPMRLEVATGRYKIYLPAFNSGYSDPKYWHVMLSPCMFGVSSAITSANQVYACLVGKGVETVDGVPYIYFIVSTADDNSLNDGGFMFQVISTYDWATPTTEAQSTLAMASGEGMSAFIVNATLRDVVEE